MKSTLTFELENFLNDIILCNRSRCGFCKAGCTTYVLTALEPLSARGRNTLSLAVIDGTLDKWDILTKTFFTCTLCGFCKEACPLKINTPEIIKSFRKYFIKEGFRDPFVEKIVFNIKKNSNPYGVQKEMMTLWAKDLSFSKKSKTLFYGGCVYPYKYPNILKSTVQVIQEIANVKMNVIFDEVCCGYPLLAMGYQNEFEELVKKNITLFFKNNVETIVTACPTCSETLSEYVEYEEQADFKVYHAIEYVNEYIEKGNFDYKLALDSFLKVTYQDPCHLARYRRVINEPRNIIRSINGLEFREMPHTKFEARCCGGGGEMAVLDPMLAVEVAKNRLKEATEINVDAIITACPTCKSMFDLVVKREKARLLILDIFELLKKVCKLGGL
ncbi:MAG: (Fe-S)-binding protein [Candidatus Bathyarchaeia archaeon]